MQRWLPIAIVVVIIHVVLITLLARSRAEPLTMREELARPGAPGATGVPGAVGGTAPVVASWAVKCMYELHGVEMRLDSIDRAGQGEWATCPEVINAQAVMLAPVGRVTRPVHIRSDIDYTGSVIATDVIQDGGNARFAANAQRMMNAIPHSTPTQMNAASAPVTYHFVLDFKRP